MVIAKLPKSNQIESAIKNPDKVAEAFISGAGKTPELNKKGKRKIPIMMRFADDILDKVDTAAKKRGISRSAFIQFVISRALEQGEG